MNRGYDLEAESAARADGECRLLRALDTTGARRRRRLALFVVRLTYTGTDMSSRRGLTVIELLIIAVIIIILVVVAVPRFRRQRAAPAPRAAVEQVEPPTLAGWLAAWQA